MKNLIIILLNIAFLSSCIVSKVRPVKVETKVSIDNNKVGFFPSISSISVIESKNNLTIDENLTQRSMEYTDQILEELNYGPKILSDDEHINYQMLEEISNFTIHAHNNKNIDKIQMSNTMYHLLEKNDIDYAIGVFTYGFDRTAENQKGQVAKAVGIGLITLGMFTVIPTRSNLTVCTMVFDRKRKSVIRYKEALKDGQKPNNKELIKELLGKSLGSYF